LRSFLANPKREPAVIDDSGLFSQLDGPMNVVGAGTAGHGSARWANAPRASITIERTQAAYVFEFNIGKREYGWEINREGYYTKYFVQSCTKDMFWSVATESDIAAATSGISTDDFSQVFNNEEDLTFEVIKSRFKHYSYNHTDEELSDILEELVE
jgi:hypothetical protein